MKKFITLISILALAVSLTACKPEDDDNPDPIVSKYSMEDFYEDLVLYEERMDSIIEEAPEDIAKQPQLQFLRNDDLDEWLVTITREEILEVYNSNSMDIIHDEYYEQLLTTRDFVKTIRAMIEGEDDIELNQDFFPSTMDDTSYRFAKSDGGYILIDALFGTSHRYLKLGLDDDRLDYQEFIYYFDVANHLPNDDITMNFHYFKFLEGTDAVHLRYSTESSSLGYTNIQKDEAFSISTGSGIIEGPSYQDSGYVLNMFDRDLNARTFLQVVGGDIIGETYDIFDEHGQVFRYDDYDNTDDMVRLQVNFVTATGWDYVVASSASNEEIDAATGIFLDDGTKIYDDWFNYTYTPTYGHLGLWIELGSKAELTNEIFSLNQYGMNLDHPKATIEFFNQVDLDSFDEIKDTFEIENLNFFAEDLHDELYQYVDEDIRNDLEGVDIPDTPIVADGDVEEYEAALALFAAELTQQPHYVSIGNTTMTLKDESGSTVSSSSTDEYTFFDLEEMFFRYVQEGSGSSYAYYIDGTKGNLVAYERDNPVAIHYELLDDIATQQNFTEAYTDFVYGGGENIIRHIEQVNDTTFELTILADNIGIGGISMVALYEQMGITGLSGQEIIITHEFREDYQYQKESYTISDLTLRIDNEDYDAELTSFVETTITEPPFMISPQDNSRYQFYLPTDKDSVVILRGLHNDRYALERGTQYLHLWLEPGEYEVEIYEDYVDTQMTVYDDQGNELPYDHRFHATYEGLYVVEIYSSTKQSTDIYVRINESPQFVEFTLEPIDNILEEHLNLNGNTWYTAIIPTSTTDRLMIINPYFIGETGEDPTVHLMLETEVSYDIQMCDVHPEPEFQEPCYIHLPANVELVMELNGYYVGEFGMTYEYLDIPTGAFDNTHTWNDFTTSPYIWLTYEQQEAFVHFTITEAGDYELDTYYKNFIHSYQDASLYSSNGTQLHYDWDHSMYLEPGDYYIHYLIDNEFGDVLVLCVPTIIKH